MIRSFSFALALLACAPMFAGDIDTRNQIASPESLAAYRAALPRTKDVELYSIFANPRTLWFGPEMPNVYQHDSNVDGRMGLHASNYNIGPREPGRRDPFGNGNLEWPWFDPHVLDNSDKGVRNYKGMLLPIRDGRNIPIVIRRAQIPSVVYSANTKSTTRTGLAWTFPAGTEFVEIVTNRVQGYDVAFKVLRMTKRGGNWDRKTYRPFPTVAEYVSAGGTSPRLVQRSRRLVDNHPVPTFDETRSSVVLDPLPESKVLAMLRETPFEECIGEEFVHGSPLPTTNAKGQIVPQGYLGSFISATQDDCINCHRDVHSHVSIFEPNRDWYGVIRGSDQIFSFNPFEPGSESWNGVHVEPRLSRRLVSMGVIEVYDVSKHNPSDYGKIQ